MPCITYPLNKPQATIRCYQPKNKVIYVNLKTYKLIPNEEAKKAIERQFDDIFSQQTSSPTLNHQLQKTYRKKEALLGVLERVESPLHNNGSETPARSAKTKLKVSGGTRSDQGREARDTFLSLRQTCLKLGINFIEFLQDRVRGWYIIPKLAEIIRQRALEELARQFSKYALAVLLAYQLASSSLSKIIHQGTSSALIKVINLGLSLNALVEKSLLCEISPKMANARLIQAEITKKSS
ncbi:MAG: transposase [Parachlamydiaceae bacterium]|nr:transposase [Parachlamydiaceae bacterium]